jgi:hypothetical protein
MRHTPTAWWRFLPLLAALATGCPSGHAVGPRFALENVELGCGPPNAEGMRPCSASAEVTTDVDADALSVLALSEGGREAFEVVVPVTHGRGQLHRAFEARATPAVTDLTVVGWVGAPTEVRLFLTDVSTDCGDGRSCRTTGRVVSYDQGPWLAVVEVRSGLTKTAFALAPLSRGSGLFSAEWSRTGEGASATAVATVAGLVVASAIRTREPRPATGGASRVQGRREVALGREP